MKYIRNSRSSGYGKTTTIVIAVATLFIILAGCNPSTSPPTEPATDQSKATMKATEIVELTVTATKAPVTEPLPATQTPIPTLAETASIDDPVLNEINERWQAYKQASQLLNQLIQYMAEDPNVMVDEGWKREVGYVLNLLDSAATGLSNISDSPPEYALLEDNLHMVAMETYLFIDNFSYAIANLDADAMGEATQNVRTMAEFSRLVDDELDMLLQK